MSAFTQNNRRRLIAAATAAATASAILVAPAPFAGAAETGNGDQSTQPVEAPKPIKVKAEDLEDYIFRAGTTVVVDLGDDYTSLNVTGGDSGVTAVRGTGENANEYTITIPATAKDKKFSITATKAEETEKTDFAKQVQSIVQTVAPGDLAKHTFVAGSTVTVDLDGTNYTNLEIAATNTGIDVDQAEGSKKYTITIPAADAGRDFEVKLTKTETEAVEGQVETPVSADAGQGEVSDTNDTDTASEEPAAEGAAADTATQGEGAGDAAASDENSGTNGTVTDSEKPLTPEQLKEHKFVPGESVTVDLGETAYTRLALAPNTDGISITNADRVYTINVPSTAAGKKVNLTLTKVTAENATRTVASTTATITPEDLADYAFVAGSTVTVDLGTTKYTGLTVAENLVGVTLTRGTGADARKYTITVPATAAGQKFTVSLVEPATETKEFTVQGEQQQRPGSSLPNSSQSSLPTGSSQPTGSSDASDNTTTVVATIIGIIAAIGGLGLLVTQLFPAQVNAVLQNLGLR